MFKPANQTHFALAIEGAEHDVQVLAFEGREALNQPYRFDIGLVSERPDLDLECLLHQSAFLSFAPDGSGIHGQLFQVAQGDSGTRLTHYQVSLVPRLAYLALRHNQRIFQHLSVPQIIAKVLEEHGILADAYRFQLGPTVYPPRDYCTQYDESDLHFLNRLCEEEGLHYHFQHRPDGHVLVLGDDATAFPRLACPTAYVPDTGLVADEPVIKRFGMRVETRTSRTTRRDYNFEKPRLLMESQWGSDSLPDLEDYDYPGRFTDRERGRQLSQRALERHRADYRLAEGRSDQPVLRTGHFLELSEHPHHDWNGLWLLTELHHEGRQPQVLEESITSAPDGQGQPPLPLGEGWGEGASISGEAFHQGYRNHFLATPWDVPYRPPLNHPKPRVLGSQTAVVTGPKGEEIHCDAYGRIKVQFHWDREGQSDEHTSCWLRVASSWAGNAYGALAIPRIGMEVLVTFLEGDPDQPLVTGCLYHAENLPSYTLPEHKTRTWLKTDSSPGGGGYNELRIEDKKGAEQIFLHAERDWDENIEHDQRIRVGHERHDTVEATAYSEFHAEEHRTTHGDRKTEVRADDHLTVANNQHVKVGTGQFIEAGDETHYYAGDKVVIGAGSELTVQGGGSWIKLDPGGVSISGASVKLNSGGSPGKGTGLKLLGPWLPAAAATALAGHLLLRAQPSPLALKLEQAEPLEEEEEEEELEEVAEEPGITLRIGMFFDGTGNNQANAAVTAQCRRDDRELYDDETLNEIIEHCARYGFKDLNADGVFSTTPNNSYGNAPSNVALLFDLYADNASIAMQPEAQVGYVKAYLEGIGTTSEGEDSLLGQATGQGETGVVRRVKQSPEIIEKRLNEFLLMNPGAKVSQVEFDIFGFSRGAAAARHFANEVLKPKGGELEQVLSAGQAGLSERFDWSADVQINFIGLFDTVAAINDPLRFDLTPNDYNPGVNLYLPPGCARKVLQLTARDEQRWQFALNSVAPHHQEIELPGVHSDIGGGYLPKAEEKLLLSKPEYTVITRQRPLRQTSAWQRAEHLVVELEEKGLPGKGTLQPVAWEVAPTPQDNVGQPADHMLVAVAIQRSVYGDLSKVTLRAMHELALQHDVPFREIPDTAQLAIPEDLQPIADKILAYARGASNSLTHSDNQLLHSRYIHLSAHWTPSKGLLISKPVPNRRLAFNNKPQEGYPE
ncbi:type VI secretion system tip protein VgrG [Metapseudomonas lalkuanensis]|nr:type VI secretion system tip protein VgrG [Pseudomonas lalkuanensis]